MAELEEGFQYGLSANSISLSNKSVVHVKLTDTSLKVIEEYLKRKNASGKQSVIQFSGNHGTIQIPDKSDELRTFQFSMSAVQGDPNGSFDAVCQTDTRAGKRLTFEGSMLHKVQVHATNELFQTTRERVTQAELDSKKNTTKVIKQSGPHISRKKTTVIRNSQPSTQPRHVPTAKPKPPTAPPVNFTKRPSPSYASQGHAVSPHNPVSASSKPTSPSLSSSTNVTSNNCNNSKSTGNPAVMSMPYRDRVIHLLAIRPYKKPELIIRLRKAMIDNIGGPRRVNNFLTTLNVPPVCNKNLKVMERRAGEVVEMVADVSARNAAQDAYQKEMMEIAEHESSEAAAEMECFEKDLGVGLMLHPSPSERHILQSSLNTDDTSEWTDVDEDESNTWNQNPKGNQAPKKMYMKDQTKSTHDAVTLKARKRLSSKFTCKTRRGMSCAVDTAWQKRGFDSSTSHTFFMSKKKFGNKVVKAVVKHKTCGTCKWWKRNRPGCKVRKHRCVANHSGSSRMMESVSGEQGLDELHKSGTPVEFIEGDGDSTLMARVREKYPGLKKRYDKNHVVKNVTKAMYNLQASKKTSLSKIAVQHIKKCLSYSISKNQGNETALKDNLKALIPHQFGDHSLCQDTFCGEKKTPGEKYVHKSLPHKMALKDDGSVRSCLEAIIAPVAANAGAYADIGCSQQCEHANREVTLRAPKSHHYGDSESLDFRVKATAACINEGRHYICQAYSEAGLSPGMYTQKYADQRMKERVREQYTSSQPSTKRRRLILKQERATNNSSLEVMEGATYQSGIDLEPSADIQKIPDAVPRAEFKPVACPQSMTVITMDLETTDLNGIREKDKDSLGSILNQVAISKDNSFTLAKHIYSEVRQDWPFYNDEDRQILKKKIQSASSVSPSASPANRSPDSQSAGQEQKRSESHKRPIEDSHSHHASKKKRVSLYDKSTPSSESNRSSDRRSNVSMTSDSSDKKENINATVGSTSDIPAYMSKYFSISDDTQRQKYKNDFNTEYTEYKELHSVIEKISKKFYELQVLIKKTPRDTIEYEDLEARIRIEYAQQKSDPKYIEQKKRFEYLHGKLAHIKKLICDYDQKMILAVS